MLTSMQYQASGLVINLTSDCYGVTLHLIVLWPRW